MKLKGDRLPKVLLLATILKLQEGRKEKIAKSEYDELSKISNQANDETNSEVNATDSGSDSDDGQK